MILIKEQATLAEQEEFNRLDELCHKYLSLDMGRAIEDIDAEAFRVAHSDFTSALERRNEIAWTVTERYIASIIHDKELILSNAAEIIAAYDASDYRAEVAKIRNDLKNQIEKCAAEAANPETDEKKRELYRKLKKRNQELLSHYAYTYECVRVFLSNIVQNERDALKRGGYEETEAELDALIDKRAAEIFPKRGKRKPLTKADVETYNAAIGQQLSLFGAKFMPMLQGTLTSGLMPISTKGLTPDKLRGGDAITKPKEDYTIVIKGYDKLQGDLGVSAKKILDTATVALTQINSYAEDNPLLINPTVEIDLVEYARANGYKVDRQPVETPEEAARQEARITEALKELKTKLNRDLDYISNISQTFTEAKGKNKGDYVMLRIISSHSIKRGKIRINFDADAARYLSRSYIMQYPTALLMHDNRNPNSYAIGRKIGYHNSMDNNQIVGTSNTLSVTALLDAAPEIITYDALKAQGQRNWKEKIKSKLEKALDDNITVGLISRWEYSTRDHTPLTREQAAELTAEEYLSLYVDFTVIDAPDQSERLAAKAEKKRLAAADKPKRKRGRPPKDDK